MILNIRLNPVARVEEPEAGVHDVLAAYPRHHGHLLHPHPHQHLLQHQGVCPAHLTQPILTTGDMEHGMEKFWIDKKRSS